MITLCHNQDNTSLYAGSLCRVQTGNRITLMNINKTTGTLLYWPNYCNYQNRFYTKA